MLEKMNPQIKIFISIAVVLILGGIILSLITLKGESQVGTSKMEIDSQYYDFGVISMADGKVSYDFNITNSGSGDLKISNIKTSCMCTEAVFKVGRKRSQPFGMHGGSLIWSEKIEPGQSAKLEVTFDPNAHGPNATGPVTRVITFYSSDGGRQNNKTVFTISANVIK